MLITEVQYEFHAVLFSGRHFVINLATASDVNKLKTNDSYSTHPKLYMFTFHLKWQCLAVNRSDFVLVDHFRFC
jgi:hypothetical protein